MLAGAPQTFASRTRLGGLVALAGGLVLAMSGCGSGGSDDVTIPRTNAEQLVAALDAVENFCNAQSETDAQAAAQQFIDGVNSLPKEVGTEAKDALREAGENLDDLASKCAPQTGTSDELTTPSTTEATTAPPTTSTPPEEDTETDTETDTPDQSPGEGNGAPHGGGNSGGVGGDE